MAVAGRVLAVRDHPHADYVWLADVDVGDRIVQIVWGGEPVVRPGCMVPVVLPGMRVHGVKIRRRTYRGQLSQGMLCSLAELGWGSCTGKVALLPESLEPGTLLVDAAAWWAETKRRIAESHGQTVSEFYGS